MMEMFLNYSFFLSNDLIRAIISVCICWFYCWVCCWFSSSCCCIHCCCWNCCCCCSISSCYPFKLTLSLSKSSALLSSATLCLSASSALLSISCLLSSPSISIFRLRNVRVSEPLFLVLRGVALNSPWCLFRNYKEWKNIYVIYIYKVIWLIYLQLFLISIVTIMGNFV